MVPPRRPEYRLLSALSNALSSDITTSVAAGTLYKRDLLRQVVKCALQMQAELAEGNAWCAGMACPSAASHSTAMTGRTASGLLSKPPPLQSFLIDGGVVIARDDGMPDFQPFRTQRRGSEAVLFASDLIEHDDGDLRDLPLIDQKRRLAELIGKAKRAVTRDGQTAFPKNWRLRNMPAALR